VTRPSAKSLLTPAAFTSGPHKAHFAQHKCRNSFWMQKGSPTYKSSGLTKAIRRAPAVPEWSDLDDRQGKGFAFWPGARYVRLNMSELNNGQNQQQSRPQTKAEIVAQREQVRMLGIALGNWREAARQCGLSEGRVLNWVVRYGWKLPKRIEAPHPREMLSVLSLLLNRSRNV
jgi:hypothetical protein